MTKRTSNKFSLEVRARAPLILLRFQYFRMPPGGCVVRGSPVGGWLAPPVMQSVLRERECIKAECVSFETK
jgi:hypothetical protein